jgi:quercetin dioxygenase-like cupin family protein
MITVKKINDVPVIPYANGAQKRVVLGRKEGVPNFVMRVFDVAPGGASSNHNHPFEHEVMILQGEATLKGEGFEQKVAVGDAFYIPANDQHVLLNKGPETLRFVCLVPLSGEEDDLPK